jgi:mannitol-1-phosphate 5-dehydrogenase
MPTLLHFGAGNIGRGLIGDVFSAGGWHIVFADVVPQVVEGLQLHGRYPLVYCGDDSNDEHWVNDVTAIDGNDSEAVQHAVVDAALLSVSVGKGALQFVAPVVADAVVKRLQAGGAPIDIIVAENIRDGAGFLRDLLQPHLPDDFDWSQLGLVTTCIGRMVPDPKSRTSTHSDPLAVFVERSTDFFADRTAFRRPLPGCPGLTHVDNMPAYADRKLFIHNLTHSAVAWLANDKASTIADAMHLPGIRDAAEAAGDEVIDGLIVAWPGVFERDELRLYLEGLLDRYTNAELGDTVYRVGRDLNRKLGRHDRAVGAMLMLAKHGLSYDNVAAVVARALSFQATDHEGKSFPGDTQLQERLRDDGFNTLEDLFGLDSKVDWELAILTAVNEYLIS